MNPNRFAITFACYNSVDYTKLFVESLIDTQTPLDRIVVVDNHSSDETQQYLQKVPFNSVITNLSNLGCGVAWDQGALALQAEWTIVMNNDVIVSPQWVENLILVAEKNNLKMISPSLIEGPLDYDFQSFSRSASEKMSDVLRINGHHAVCIAIHNSVWEKIGYFQPSPTLLGYEDTLFFHHATKAGIIGGLTGKVWLHHYGSITQTAMKLERGLKTKDRLGIRTNYKLLNQTWFQRKWRKFKKTRQSKQWRSSELTKYGMTVHGIRNGGAFEWK